ncbi:MAG: DUF2079 domain-containing protein [Clostridia bacterium]|nr:DUF2079 domain-containing protein [Clostridia bacterium]
MLIKLVILFTAASGLFILVLNFIPGLVRYSLLSLCITAVVALVIVCVRARLTPLGFSVMIFFLAFAAKLIFSLVVETKPISDFLLFYDAAKMAAAGDYTFQSWCYFSVWANQSGIVLFYAGIMKLFGIGLTPLITINCLFMAGTNLLVYLMAREFATEKAARASALLYLFYPAPYLLAPVLTNQHSADFLFFLSAWLFAKKGLKSYPYVLLSAFIAVLGNGLRLMGIIPVAAVLFLTAIGIFQSFKNKKRLLSYLKAGLSYCLVFILCWTLLSKSAAWLGVNPKGLENTFPLWKFVVGLNHDSNGQFNVKDQNLLMYQKDIEERDRLAAAMIKKRVSVGSAKLFYLAIKKELLLWTKSENTGFTFTKRPKAIGIMGLQIPFEALLHQGLHVEKVFYLFAFLLMAAGSLCRLKDKEVLPLLLLIQLYFGGYFLSHILVEVQPRYRYFAMIAVFTLASLGFEKLEALKESHGKGLLRK